MFFQKKIKVSTNRVFLTLPFRNIYHFSQIARFRHDVLVQIINAVCVHFTVGSFPI